MYAMIWTSHRISHMDITYTYFRKDTFLQQIILYGSVDKQNINLFYLKFHQNII